MLKCKLLLYMHVLLLVCGTTIIHSVTEISKEDYEAYNERIAKINKKEG